MNLREYERLAHHRLDPAASPPCSLLRSPRRMRVFNVTMGVLLALSIVLILRSAPAAGERFRRAARRGEGLWAARSYKE